MSNWQPTACNLCECNCGIEVELGGDDGRRFVRVRGDKQHPSSRGYACEKPHRLDYYQNGRDRLRAPLRRKPDGSFEEIDWDTAIREVAARFAAVRDTHGGASIFYYGGGGQGNHLPGACSAATRAALGSTYRSNALAQEKTGEFWVSANMLGVASRGDAEHCEGLARILRREQRRDERGEGEIAKQPLEAGSRVQANHLRDGRETLGAHARVGRA